MPRPPSLTINLDRLDRAPIASRYALPPAWWVERSRDVEQPGYAYEVASPIAFALEAQVMGETVYLVGSVDSEIDVECSRCVARYRHALRDSFRLVLEPAGSRIPADPEGAEALSRDGVCLGEEIDAGWYRGRELDLGSWFAEIVALSMPVQPLCQTECSGLCPHCGVDLNSATCDCAAEARPESPFAVLASLKQGLQGD